jgi:hypothetical protein
MEALRGRCIEKSEYMEAAEFGDLSTEATKPHDQ